MKKKYRALVVGCGAHSRHHFEMLAKLGIGIAAAVDLKPERAREKKESFGAEEWGTDYRQFINKPDIDFVSILTWPSSHAEIAVNSMEAGKHVFCEKPMAATLVQAERMIADARKTGKKMLFGYVLRYNDSYRKIAEMIRQGKIGKPIIMRMGGAEHTITKPHWDEDQALLRDTSPVIDCGCHYVDVMRWFTGEEPLMVSGIGCRIEKETPRDKYDWGKIILKFNHGSVGFYEVGWGHQFRGYNEKEFIGPKGRLRLVHSDEGDLVEYYSYPGKYKIMNVPGEHKPTSREYEDLIEHIEQDKNCRSYWEDAYRSLRIVLAGHRAIMEGKDVPLKSR